MSYHLTPVRISTVKKTKCKKCWRGCAERAMLIHCWRENQLIVIVVNEYGGCSKIKSKLPSYLAISFAGIYPKE